MEIALLDGVRSFPRPGAAGHCQKCGQAVIAKCGEKLVWHWAHKGRGTCDPWWENEGPWHREWKQNFPGEWHEVLAYDASGEAHIADVKLPNELVIELQHSAMPIGECRSREQFYGNMIWIVDAAPFQKNLEIFDPLPNPNLSWVDDLVFATPQPTWRSSLVIYRDRFDGLMFYRKSERISGESLVRWYSGRELADRYPAAYDGHHLFYWHRPREVWLQTTKPTFLDFGGGIMAELMRYGDPAVGVFCLRLLSKNMLISRLLQSVKCTEL